MTFYMQIYKVYYKVEGVSFTARAIHGSIANSFSLIEKSKIIKFKQSK